MARTDVVLQKVLEELERCRPWLDRMPDIRTLVIDIKMIRETGLPRAVIIRTETEREKT